MEEEPLSSEAIREQLLETMQRAFDARQTRDQAAARPTPSIDPRILSRYARGDRSLADEILSPFRGSRSKSSWSRIVAMAKPALSIEVNKGATGGRSRLGGKPDLAAGTDWPRKGGKPMYFLGQFDLAEVSRHVQDDAIPADGLMSFFWEADKWTDGYLPEEADAWRVVVSSGSSAEASPPPPEVEDGVSLNWTFEGAGVSMKPVISLPGADHILIERLALGDDAWQQHRSLLEEIREAQGITGLTQFLGYPAEIQSDPLRSAHIAAHGIGIDDEERRSVRTKRVARAREKRRLLFQLDSVSELGMEWADSGVVYFTIEDADLRAGHLERTWLIMDSL